MFNDAKGNLKQHIHFSMKEAVSITVKHNRYLNNSWNSTLRSMFVKEAQSMIKFCKKTAVGKCYDKQTCN